MKNIFSRYSVAYISIAVGCIYLSGHSYSIIAGATAKVLMLVLCFLGCLLMDYRIRIPQKLTLSGTVIISTFLGILLSYSFYFNQNVYKNSWLDPILLLGIMLVAHMIIIRIPMKNFAKMYSSLLTFLTAIAIIIWYLVERGVYIPSYTYVSLNGFSYKTIWICTWIEQTNRLMGPFWEAGLYSSMAIIAILCEGCFTEIKLRKINLAILTTGILLSSSTAGIILILPTYYIILRRGVKLGYFWDAVVVIFVIAGFLYGDYIIERLIYLNYNVFWKLEGNPLTTNTRLMSPIACLRIFSESPLTGVGLSYAVERYNSYKPILRMDALTSTSAFMLAAFGIWGVAYTFAFCKAILSRTDIFITSRIIILILFLIIINKEPHTFIMITYVFMFYLCKKTESELNLINIENKK